MNEYIFGANILENLTTGMYQDSKVLYREYIQNACDQIDKAYAIGLLRDNNGTIDIWLDAKKRIVSIEDNATGVRAAEFEHTLADIANSDKKLGEDKGFRGIGRLCGLAYCKQLIFSSTAAGENTVSIMKCDASKMRQLISENARGQKHTASEVLHAIYTFSSEKTADVANHWFKVKMIGINNENNDLLDFAQIKDYLSFVAPVPYQNTFIFRAKVYDHAKELKQKLDEYTIRLNGEQVFKKYKTHFKTSKGNDDIFNVAFKDIYDSKNNLLAWLWIGVSHFKAIISKDCAMRGLRLRKENIQIGNDDALQKLFKEDRGHHYFIGEVFAVANDLIPNSQRDYFNENAVRNEFECSIRKYFNEELGKIYKEGSAINSLFGKIDAYEKKKAEFDEKRRNRKFISKNHYNQYNSELEKAKINADKSRIEIEKKKQKADAAPNNVVSQVIARIEKDRELKEDKPNNRHDIKDNQPPSTLRVDKLSSYSKSERKLISKIFEIIASSVDEETAETIIRKIENGLQ